MKASKRILITGASGFLGTRLTQMLEAKGYEVYHLSRSKKNAEEKTFVWDVRKQTIEKGALSSVDAIIHLAGASVAEKRWTEERKKEIIDSRTQSADLLYNTLKTEAHHVKTFISASAIGYYGFTRDEVFTESSSPGSDFLARVTVQWEKAADKIADLGIRLVKIRIGVVLGNGGGALEPIAKAAKALVGSPLGSGNQYMSWIHLDDVCAMFIHALEQEQMNGPYNAVAPKAVTNRELTKKVAKVLHKPMIFPSVPAFVLKIMFGEMSEIILFGSKVSPDKILATGFVHRFPDLDQTLNDLLKN
jgi:uncharacterized protein (TIGR01777 family)